LEKTFSQMKDRTISRNLTASSRLWLDLLRTSYSAKQISAIKHLWLEHWTPKAARGRSSQALREKDGSDSDVIDEENAQVDQRNGLNMRHSIKEYGMAWQPDMWRYNDFCLMEEHLDGFLLDSPAFVGAFTKRANRVFDTVDTYESIEHITELIALHADHPGKMSLIRDFTYGIIISQFRRDLWSKAKSLTADSDILARGDLAFTHANAKLFAAPFLDLFITSPNLAFDHRNFGDYVRYIFDARPWASTHNNKARRRNLALTRAPFYLAYGTILNVITEHLAPAVVEKWVKDFNIVFILTNPFLPMLAADGPIVKTKKTGSTPEYLRFISWKPMHPIGDNSNALTSEDMIQAASILGFTAEHQGKKKRPECNRHFIDEVHRLTFEEEYLGLGNYKMKRKLERALSQLD